MKYILIMDLEARKLKTERLYQVIYNIAIHHRKMVREEIDYVALCINNINPLMRV